MQKKEEGCFNCEFWDALETVKRMGLCEHVNVTYTDNVNQFIWKGDEVLVQGGGNVQRLYTGQDHCCKHWAKKPAGVNIDIRTT